MAGERRKKEGEGKGIEATTNVLSTHSPTVQRVSVCAYYDSALLAALMTYLPDTKSKEGEKI